MPDLFDSVSHVSDEPEKIEAIVPRKKNKVQKSSRRKSRVIDRKDYSRKINEACGWMSDDALDFSKMNAAELVLLHERVAHARNVPTLITAIVRYSLPEAIGTGFDLVGAIFHSLQGLAGSAGMGTQDFPIVRALASGFQKFFAKK